MKRLLFVSALVLMVATSLQAAPVQKLPLVVTQPDGSRLELFATGDEYFNWLTDRDGFVVLRDPSNGWYVYAESEGGDWGPGELVVGQNDPTSSGLKPGLLPSKDEITTLRYDRSQKARELARSAPHIDLEAVSEISINNLTVMIRFQGEPEFGRSQAHYDSIFNLFAPDHASLASWYDEVSYGKVSIGTTFLPESAGGMVVSYEDSHPRDYYRVYNSTTNPTGYAGTAEKDARENTLLKNALEAVQSALPPELNLDNDSDGFVDALMFVIQGGVEGWAELLWPHQYWLYLENVTLNGARAYAYSFFIEDHLEVRREGVLCHEMYHAFGAPDIYHFSYDGLTPVGPWDMMGNTSLPPQHTSLYSKFAWVGWVDDIPWITASGTYTIHDITHPTGNGYRIAAPYSSSEYLVVEYRNASASFLESPLPASGVIVSRVNSELEGEGNWNGPPDELYVYRPDGTLTVDGDLPGAAYNQTAGRTEIHAGTNPIPFLSNGYDSGIRIDSIRVEGDSATFRVTLPASGPREFALQLDPTTGEVSLQWQAPSDGAPSGGYRVYRDWVSVAETADLSWSEMLSGYGRHEYFVTGLLEDAIETAPTQILSIDWYNQNADILVWEPDATPSSGVAIDSLLNLLGYQTRYLAGSLPDSLDKYAMIYASLGVSSAGAYAITTGGADETALMEYLDGGGVLYMEGGDAFGYEPPANLVPYFNVTGVQDGDSDLFSVLGEAGTFSEGVSMDYAGPNFWMDHVEPGTGAVRFLENPGDGGGCGVLNNAGSYQTVAVTLELGSLTDGSGNSTRAYLINGIMNWLGLNGLSGIDVSPVGLPGEFSIDMVYPNPFNGRARVGISLPHDGVVELELFNLLGQSVWTSRQKCHAGRNIIQLLPTGEFGSGLYFVRAEMGGVTRVAKLVQLK